MGKVIAMVKKWWVLALVFTLAMSLTSCSSKKRALTGGGQFPCDGSIGQFDGTLLRSPNNPALFELELIPIKVDRPGDVVSITVANRNADYKDMLSAATLDNDTPIFVGHLTESELRSYPILAILGVRQGEFGVPFPDRNPEKDAYCILPDPDENGNLQ